MTPQELSNHHLQVAAEHIAEACTSAHLVEDDHGQSILLVYRGKERLGTFDGGTFLFELLKEQVEPEERPYRFEVDGKAYIGWAAIGRAVIEENNRKGLLPLQDMIIEVTDSDGNDRKTITGMDVLFVMQQAGAVSHGPIESAPIIRLT